MSRISPEADKFLASIRKEHFSYVFPEIDKECFSYFEDCNVERDSSITEFEFTTIPELKKLLQRKQVMNSDMLDTVCAVCAFKNKPQADKEDEKETSDGNEDVLPAFIYNF